jgi:hypothetical protein
MNEFEYQNVINDIRIKQYEKAKASYEGKEKVFPKVCCNKCNCLLVANSINYHEGYCLDGCITADGL